MDDRRDGTGRESVESDRERGHGRREERGLDGGATGRSSADDGDACGSAVDDGDGAADTRDPATADRPVDDGDVDDHPVDDSDAAGRPARRSTRVHVRRLDALDTLRWSWGVARHRRELFGVALAAGLPAVVAVAGVTRSSPTADLEVADWVLPAYLAQLLGLAVAAGVVSLTAADAVAGETLTAEARPLGARVLAAAKRLPALAATAVAVGALVALGWLPSYAAMEGGRYLLGLGLLVVPAYLLDRLLLAFQACVVDRAGPVASVRAGWRATRENARKVFLVAVAYLLVVLVSDYVAAAFGGPYDVAPALVGAAVGAVLFPVFGLALAHLYLESSRNW